MVDESGFESGLSSVGASPVSDRELLCTVGEIAVTGPMYPSDKICMYLFYTDVVIIANKLYGARVESSWQQFQKMAKDYRKVKLGVSFDHRTSSSRALSVARFRYITVPLLKGAAPALTALKSGGIGNFGVLNILTEPRNLRAAVIAMRPVIQEIKDTMKGHTVIAIGSFDYSNTNFDTFADVIKLAVDTFAADTVIAMSSVNSIQSREECRATPPGLLTTTRQDRSPSLVRFCVS
ncbi:hypothetical protein HPB50_024272 [Hyalomma asiaticum]|uniref:Uncharacterized protein n=1 Tax=Hyalomma asiaticum TaxID=266040 RepID=A0ACB7RWP1_HYAAI|nr:hypothetical protein HPB50_024272 [Hyalomma asiaticum]